MQTRPVLVDKVFALLRFVARAKADGPLLTIPSAIKDDKGFGMIFFGGAREKTSNISAFRLSLQHPHH